MNNYLCQWNYSGNRIKDSFEIKARNLPEALAQAAELNRFRIRGETLIRHGNRRIRFFGQHGEGVTRIPAPLIEGVIFKI